MALIKIKRAKNHDLNHANTVNYLRKDCRDVYNVFASTQVHF